VTLRTGIIGVGGYGGKVLPVLAQNDLFDIRAIGDQNAELAKDMVRRYGGEPYDDYRSLFAQQSLDVLFLFLPNHLCGDCIRWAAQKKIHLFKDAPLARTLPEGAQWVELMKKSGCRFGIGAQRRFAPSYGEAHQRLTQGSIGEIYLIRGELFGTFSGELGWRGDPVLAGGGVLLEWGYQLLDMLIWNVGVPERIFSQRGAFWSKQALPPYKTEDTMILNLKLTQDAVGVFAFGWQTQPPAEQMCYYGSEGTLSVDPNRIQICDRKGNVTLEQTHEFDASRLIDRQIRQFGASLLDSEALISPAEEHLATIAAIESAYLSARTQLPETLQVYGLQF